MAETRRYERIDIELPCRLFIPGDGGLRFEAFTVTQNLGLGGIYVASSFLLRNGLEVMAELTLPSGPLAVRTRVAHAVPLDHETYRSGMGLEFLGVDARGRETLLRYFSPARYHEFYDLFTTQFPHLRKDVPLSDVSLLLNLWEEWKGANQPPSPETPAPRRPRR